MDPSLDGFGHHNRELTQGDDLWFNSLAIDCMLEGLFQGWLLSANETQFRRLIRMGILDGVEGFCQGHSSLDAPSELNPPQRIPSPLLLALLVPQAEG